MAEDLHRCRSATWHARRRWTERRQDRETRPSWGHSLPRQRRRGVWQRLQVPRVTGVVSKQVASKSAMRALLLLALASAASAGEREEHVGCAASPHV
jgi:hypothetical protein